MSNPYRLARSAVAALALSVAALVCGCSQQARLVPAEGVVTIGGAPAANISVQFLPEVPAGSPGPTSYATSDQNGKFRLKTYDGRDGAVVGKHRVVLADLDEERPAQGKPLTRAPRLDSRYTSATMGLAAEVKEGGGPIELKIGR